MEPFNRKRVVNILRLIDRDDENEAIVVFRQLRLEAARTGLTIIDLLFRAEVILELNKQAEVGWRVSADILTRLNALCQDIARRDRHCATALVRVIKEETHLR